LNLVLLAVDSPDGAWRVTRPRWRREKRAGRGAAPCLFGRSAPAVAWRPTVSARGRAEQHPLDTACTVLTAPDLGAWVRESDTEW
jgi:hypothetical protein